MPKICYLLGACVGYFLAYVSVFIVRQGWRTSGGPVDDVEDFFFIGVIVAVLFLIEFEVVPKFSDIFNNFIEHRHGLKRQLFWSGAWHIALSGLLAASGALLWIQIGGGFFKEGILGFTSILFLAPILFMATHVLILIVETKRSRKGNGAAL